MTARSRLTAAARRLHALARHSRGNVAVITAVVALPLTLAAGMGIDYTLASYRQDQINGFADSATLAAVTPNMMASASADQSKAVTLANFNAQLTTVPNISYSASNISVTATDTNTGTTVSRTVTLTYTIASNNIFSKLLGMNTLSFSGSSTAVSSTAPNIDFWMLLDDSGSMQLAATTTDLQNMVNLTQTSSGPGYSSQGACTFACHESNPGPEGFTHLPETINHQTVTDLYTLARAEGITLRMDLVNDATSSLLGTAYTTEKQYNTTYRFAVYTMDKQANAYSISGGPNFASPLNFCPPPAPSPGGCITTGQPSGNTTITATPTEYYQNNEITPGNNDNDTDTYSDASLASVSTLMGTPGNGTNNPGDKPQQVLFIVSDGLGDYYSGSNRVFVPIGSTNVCTQIKAKGIRIAFLYLTYNPLPGTGSAVSWYNSNVASTVPNILPAVQSCASPGLFFQVNTDGDVTAAMTSLFQRAVTTARLTQ